MPSVKVPICAALVTTWYTLINVVVPVYHVKNNSSVSVYYTYSTDGTGWTELRAFQTAQIQRNKPTFIALDNAGTGYTPLVFFTAAQNIKTSNMILAVP